MKRMRMQRALWYLGTPGTTVTSMLGSGPAGSASPACLSCSGGPAGEAAGVLAATVMPGTSVSSGSDAEAVSEAGSESAAGSGSGADLDAGADLGSGADSGSALPATVAGSASSGGWSP